MKFRENTKRTVRIKYLPFNYKGVDLFLPMVNVCLKHKGHDVPSLALIDSGATSTFIPLSIAQLLELELRNLNSNVAGAGGSFQSYSANIEKISVIKGTTILAEFNHALVRIPSKKEGIPFVILGRDSIFFRYDIKFQENKQQLQLVRMQKNNYTVNKINDLQ